MALLALFGVALLSYHLAPQPIGVPAQVLQRLAALEATVNAQSAPPTPLTPAATPPVEQRQQQKPWPLDTPEQFAAQLRHQHLALAAIYLGISTRGHQPFQREWALLHQIGQNEPRLRIPLEGLAPHAANGVATVIELRDAFGIILLPKLEALGNHSERSWSEQIGDWWDAAVASDEPNGAALDPSYRLIAAAMERLGEDDLRGAVELLARLEGAAATLTARWLTEARARLAVDAASQSLSEVTAQFLLLDSAR